MTTDGETLGKTEAALDKPIYSARQVMDALDAEATAVKDAIHKDRVQQFLTAVDAVEGRGTFFLTSDVARSIALMLRKHGIS